MIQVETTRPVFSNLTDAEKKARKKRLGDKAKGIYTKAKESGILAGIENLALGRSNAPADKGDMSAYQQPIVDQSKTGMSKGLKTGLIVGGVLLLGVSVWYFVFRKK